MTTRRLNVKMLYFEPTIVHGPVFYNDRVQSVSSYCSCYQRSEISTRMSAVESTVVFNTE